MGAAFDELAHRSAAQFGCTHRGQRALDVQGSLHFDVGLVLDGLGQAHEEDFIDTLTIATDGEPVVLKLVKPCGRCSIPDVDPVTAVPGTAVGQTLAGYRSDARLGGAITFGMNAVIVSGMGATLRVGSPVAVGLAL